MATLNRILVAVGALGNDRAATPAITRAVALARLTGARLRLAASVYDPYVAGERFRDSADLDQARAGLVDGRRAALEELAGPLRAAGLDVGVSACWAYPLFEGLAAEAQAFGADLLVAEPSRLARPGLANSDWQLIRHCPCPVLLSRSEGEGGYREILVPVDPMHAHDRPGTLDDALISAALALRQSSGARLHLLHCYLPPEYVPFRAPGAARSAVFHRRESSLEAHRVALRQLAQRHGIPESMAQLEPGDAREAIPDFAVRLGADLVVMGVVARSRLKRLLIGSTAESVLDRLACDVLAVKPAPIEA